MENLNFNNIKIAIVEHPTPPGGHAQSPKKLYEFRTFLTDLKPGDHVICDTRFGPQIGAVKEVKEDSDRVAHQCIIEKVDMDSHNLRMAAAADYMRAVEAKHAVKQRMEALRKEIESRRSALPAIEIYRAMANEDPQMSLLMKEYEKLNEAFPQTERKTPARAIRSGEPLENAFLSEQ